MLLVHAGNFVYFLFFAIFDLSLALAAEHCKLCAQQRDRGTLQLAALTSTDLRV